MLCVLVIAALLARALAGTISSQNSIVSAGQNRTFYYYAPDNYNPALGMMIYLHGGGGNGLAASGQATDYLWRLLADRVGLFTIFPDGKSRPDDPTKGTWNDCLDGTLSGCEVCDEYDDVQFIRDIIHWASTSYDAHLNLNRVYAAGESKGSMMSMRLALEANDVIAAVGSVVGNVPVSNDNSGTYKCKGYDAPYSASEHAVPILLWKGDDDPNIPFGETSGTDHNIYPLQGDPCYRPAYGQQCPPAFPNAACVNGCVHSFFDSLAFWEWKHGLSPNRNRRVVGSQTLRYADTVPDCTDDCATCDGSHVIRHNIGPSPYRVAVLRAVGGGHHFPGPGADTPDCKIYNKTGWKNRDELSAPGGHAYLAEEIWAFVSQFSLTN